MFHSVVPQFHPCGIIASATSNTMKSDTRRAYLETKTPSHRIPSTLQIHTNPFGTVNYNNRSIIPLFELDFKLYNEFRIKTSIEFTTG